MSDVFSEVQAAHKRLSNRGYQPDALFVGTNVYAEMTSLSNHVREVGTMQDDTYRFGYLFGCKVTCVSWLQRDEAVLACTHNEHDAILLGEASPHYYADAAERFCP